jgi:hypothetical protein
VFKIEALRTIFLTDLRLLLRRPSSIWLVLIIVFFSWNLPTDWRDGMAMFVVGQTRIIYDSAGLALASALQLAPMLGLAGFYIVRGRIYNDTKNGVGSVLGVMPVSNAVLLMGRWIAAIFILCLVIFIACLTALIAHNKLGETPLEILPYFKYYFIILLPGIIFAASMAILSDAYAPLIGKLADVLFFPLWMLCVFSLYMFAEDRNATSNPLQLIDFSGFGTSIVRLVEVFNDVDIRVGGRSSFDASLTPLTMPDTFFSFGFLLRRFLCALIACLPLVFAIRKFHRFSPDQLKIAAAGNNSFFSKLLSHLNKPIALLNKLSRYLIKDLNPLFVFLQQMPGWRGQIAAELVLTILSNPASLPVLIFCILIGPIDDGILIFTLTCWGVLISDISSRDVQSGTDSISGSSLGGKIQRSQTQFYTSVILGICFASGTLISRLIFNPEDVLASLVGLFFISSVASFLGRATGKSRSFLIFFLTILWLSIDNPAVPAFDLFGTNKIITSYYLYLQVLVALLLIAAEKVLIWRKK